MSSFRLGLVALAAALASVLACADNGDTGSSVENATAAATILDGDDVTVDQLLTLAPIGDGTRAAAIVFPSDISVAPVVRGHLVPGGRVSVVFALDRLPVCRASHNGVGIWDTRIGGEFSNRTLIGERRGPDGAGGTFGRLVSFANGQGGSSARGHAVPFTFEIPSDARSFELYAHNSSPPGPSPKCDTFDSRFDENYTFSVETSP